MFLLTERSGSTFFPDDLRLSRNCLLISEWTVLMLDLTSAVACLISPFLRFGRRTWTSILHFLRSSLWIRTDCNLFVSDHFCVSHWCHWNYSVFHADWVPKEFCREFSQTSETIVRNLGSLSPLWRELDRIDIASTRFTWESTCPIIDDKDLAKNVFLNPFGMSSEIDSKSFVMRRIWKDCDLEDVDHEVELSSCRHQKTFLTCTSSIVWLILFILWIHDVHENFRNLYIQDFKTHPDCRVKIRRRSNL